MNLKLEHFDEYTHAHTDGLLTHVLISQTKTINRMREIINIRMLLNNEKFDALITCHC